MTPDLEIKSVLEINPDFLEKKGIKALIFDVDNTLARYCGTSVDSSIAENFSELTRRFKSCILSNTTPERRAQLEDMFGLPVVQSTGRKPFPNPFYEALSYLGTEPARIGMIGDRLLTDIAGAKKMGMFTVKVGPLKRFSEPVPHMVVRGFESLVLRFYQEEGFSEKTYLARQD